MRKRLGNAVVGEALMLSPGENVVTVVPSQVSVPECRQQGEQTSRIRCPCTATEPGPCVGLQKGVG